MRKTATRLTKVRINGQRYWCVIWPKIGKGRNRRFFRATGRSDDDQGKREAETFLSTKLIERENYGTAAMAFTERQRAEYLESAEKLKPFGKTIRDAVAFYLPHLQATNRTCTAVDLVAELLKVKAADGASERYLGDLRSRLGHFAADFDGKPIAEITALELDNWLRSLADADTGKLLAPTTRNNFRRVLIVAFNFAQARGYCVGNPASKSAEAKEVKLAAGILTVQQAADLLSHSDDKIVPAVALGFFAGLRPEAEGQHLDWSHIDFSDRTINIEPDKTKADSSARYVNMADNLVAWLTPYRKNCGKIFPPLTEYYELLREARDKAKITSWPHDACRHCFGSYHYGAHRSAAETQAQMGHSNAKIFFKHYRKPLKQSLAARYWNIFPLHRKGKKVVQFKAAA